MLKEILSTIVEINADKFRTKKSKEKTMKGKWLYNPDALNKEFKKIFARKSWEGTRYDYYVTTEPEIMQKLMNLNLGEQKKFLESQKIKNR